MHSDTKNWHALASTYNKDKYLSFMTALCLQGGSRDCVDSIHLTNVARVQVGFDTILGSLNNNDSECYENVS